MARDLPDILARAEAQAAGRPRRPLAAEEIEGLRRAIGREFAAEGLVLAKSLTDGTAGPAERRILSAALARLAGLYEAAREALPMEARGSGAEAEGPGGEEAAAEAEGPGAQEPAGGAEARTPEAPAGEAERPAAQAEPPRQRTTAGEAAAAAALATAVEARARALEALLRGEPEAAREEAIRSADALDRLPAASTAAVDPPALVDVAGRVYDRSTGRSRYDPDEEGHLPFRLVCPRDVCGAVHDARLEAGHSTHRLTCPVCGVSYLVYLAPVRSASRRAASGLAVHEIETQDADGTLRTLGFEDPAGSRGPRFDPGELLVATYDGDNRLRRVQAYGRASEVRVPAPARCFVATAAAGPFAPEVMELRRLRDEVLANGPAGRAFIRWYGRRGPALAAVVAASPFVRRCVRGLLRRVAPLSARLRLVLGRRRA